MPKWSKLGRVFVPNQQFDWMNSHAAVPFAEHIGDNYFYVYFSCRDKENRSYTARMTAEISDNFRVLDLFSEPIISPGEIGCFDDDGAMLSWILRSGQYNYYYYIGWNRGVTVPFRNSIGLAVGKPGQIPVRLGKGPILDRTFTEPHFVASACVLPDEERWRAWYLSCTGWDLLNGSPRHRYHIKYATSEDRIYWQRDGLVSIDYKDDGEYAISRPSVLYFGDRMEMWYSFRGKKYRIGYAHSRDGLNWQREDDSAGIAVSEIGWDSDMIEYPHVFMHNDQCYMLYNGNDYGRSGFGIAIREP